MLTRRNFLRTTKGMTLAGVALSGAALLGVTQVDADSTSAVSKDQAGYKDTPNGSQSCAMCKNFKAPNACMVVSGSVAPQGWCKLFVAKSAA